MSDDEDAAPAPPMTGVEAVDEALASIDLTGKVSTHPERVAAALDVLQQLLASPRTQTTR